MVNVLTAAQSEDLNHTIGVKDRNKYIQKELVKEVGYRNASPLIFSIKSRTIRVWL